MTIKVEREALVSALEGSTLWQSLPCVGPSISTTGDECVVLSLPSKTQCLDVDSLRSASYSDEDSVCASSTSSDSFSSESSIERRVTFASELVTEEWTRPFTPREDISSLYYSTEDTNRFRHEYRLERKVLSELSIDPETFPVDEDLSNLIADSPKADCSFGRHSISRVVVLHNNKLKTFFDFDDTFQKDQPLSGDFFDNDSFWSGSLTWY